MEIFLLWAGLAIVAGIAARGRGRSGLLWFVIAALFSPLIALILLAFLPRIEAGERPRINPVQPIPAESMPCPFCAETIKAAAIVCKHCGRDIPSAIADSEIVVAVPRGDDKACPGCGGASPAWARVCRSCGRKYDDSTAEQAGRL